MVGVPAPFELGGDPVARAAAVAALGQRSRLGADDAAALRHVVTSDPDARVRAAALGALVRQGSTPAAADAWHHAVGDGHTAVRRRAAELTPELARVVPGFVPGPALVALLGDSDVTVVDAAAWAFGELSDRSEVATSALCDVATGHTDPLAREAAVAALGARGDEAALGAVLRACRDVPTVRRRAVLALAPFHGAAVDAALADALGDRDWQVRQAAEDLLGTSRPSDDDPETGQA